MCLSLRRLMKFVIKIAFGFGLGLKSRFKLLFGIGF